MVAKYRKGGGLKIYNTGIKISFSFQVLPPLLFPFDVISGFAKSYDSLQFYI